MPVLPLAVVAWILAAAPDPSPGDRELLPGDRVVFLGDSITAAHRYTRLVELHAWLREPGRPVTWINSGVGGHTALDGLARVEQDVAAWRPTVVVVNFGMNEAGDPPDTPPGRFESNVVRLLDAVRAVPGVRRVLWADTSPVDTEGLKPRDPAVARGKRIRELVAFAGREGSRRGVTVVGWHAALSNALERFRAAGIGRDLIPDRVHPGPAGHAVMAVELLRALGADLSPAEVRARLRGGTLEVHGKRGRSTVGWDGRGPVDLDLSVAPPPVPFLRVFQPGEPVPPEVADLARLVLRVEGLPAGRWRVEAAGEVLARGDARDLAAGVDLMAGLPREPRSRKELSPEERRNYGPGVGALGLDGWYRLWDLSQAKDRARYLLRADQVALMPATIPGYLDRFQGLLADWFEEAARGLGTAAAALATAPRTVRLVPEGR